MNQLCVAILSVLVRTMGFYYMNATDLTELLLQLLRSQHGLATNIQVWLCTLYLWTRGLEAFFSEHK